MADEEFSQAMDQPAAEAPEVVESAPVEEMGAQNGEAPTMEEEAHDAGATGLVAPEGEDEEAAAEDGYADGDVSNKQVFIAEVTRIEESASTIVHSLAAVSSTNDEELIAHMTDVVADIQAEEANLFHPLPDYIAPILQAEAERRANRAKGVQPHDDVIAGSGLQTAGNYNEEHRAFVDPSVPLSLPYSLEREQNENPNRNPVEGVYHDLFYGDGTKCVFAPPENNKRIQIEEMHRARRIEPRPPVSYEPPKRKTLKVGADFVPSCATGVSASQRYSANSAYRESSAFTLRSSPTPRNSKAVK